MNIQLSLGMTLAGEYFFIHRSDGVNSYIHQYHLKTGAMKPVQLPLSGMAFITGYNENTNRCILNFSSWKQAFTMYHYDPVTGKTKDVFFTTNVKYPGTEDLVVEEVEAIGHDGVSIPLSLVYNKLIKRDGSNVVLMKGYGSYGNSSTPWFNAYYLPLMNKGVIIAVTHPRGGGEKGEQWHNASKKINKPNTWKDFTSCAEYLIKNGYTSPKHIVGEGASAGGILIGRAITERPDLFAASLHVVPISNSLRHENRMNGATDANEFGTVKDSLEAMSLIEKDAYLHVKKDVAYPAVLAVAGINDTRVPAWQPGKLVAALQSSVSERPHLLLVQYEGGHMMSDDKYVQFRNAANELAFALWQAGHKDFQLVDR